MFISWGLGEGWWSLSAPSWTGGLLGAVFIFQNLYSPHGSAPETAREFYKAISPLEAATSLVALTKAPSELSARPLPGCAGVQWVDHQEAAEFKFCHFPALVFLFLGIA